MQEVDEYDDMVRLMHVVQEIALARKLGDVTRIVKHAARRLSRAEGVTFVLRDGDQCYYVDEDAISPLWKGRRFPAESCISGWAMMHRKIVVIEDIYADARIPHDAYRPTFVKSLLMIPVRSSDPIAAIGAYWAQTHRATEREVALLQALADTTAVAIDNVQMIEALKTRAEESAALLEQFKQEVTKREEVEEQLRQSQKMEAIGRLAGGIAHDFNNLLTVISGYSDLMLGLMGQQHEYREHLEQIFNASERAASLTRQLLAFSRKQVLQPAVLNLNSVVAQMDKLLRRLIGEDIDLVTRLHSGLDAVTFDPGQIEQIVMNLAVNARDAMPQGGKLTIETANVELDASYAQAHTSAQPGPHVMIAVTDTGTGMDAETKARIFEPFFTTKEKGKGTGLGLATVYGIVKQSGGNIWVYSEPGHGTTFKIYLPRAEAAADPKECRTTTEPQVPQAATILMVEDEEAVRTLLRRVLEGAGYTVLAAADAEEALKLCQQHREQLQLLLTDVVLPKSGGPQLAAQIEALCPGLKVAFMSGYTDNAMVHRGLLDAGAAFIEKPIAPKLLLEKIREYLSPA
jgi:signal transduction histidine kinase